MNLTDMRNRRGERLDTTFHPGHRDGVLVVLGHGVTGNKDRPVLVAVAEGLAARGWPCLRLSFAGNGDSGGNFGDATIPKERDDLLDLLDILPPELEVIYCGHSMGGAVGVLTAAVDRRIRVLVTLAGMIRTSEFCEREFGQLVPDEGCMWDEPACPLSRQYVSAMHETGNLLATVAQLRVPYLLIHGTADDLVSVGDSRDACAAANEPKRLVEIEGAGHTFDDASYPQVIEAIAAWLITHVTAMTRRPGPEGQGALDLSVCKG